MAPAPVNFLRRCLRLCWSTAAALIVLAAVAVTLVRVSLPNIDRFSDPIAGWLGVALHARVEFDQLQARWIGWSPELILTNVRLLEPEQGALLAHFDTAGVVIDPLTSLLNRNPTLHRLWVEGARLGITREEDGSLSVLSLETKQQDAFIELVGWLRNQSDLELRNASLIWEDLRLKHPPTRLEPVTVRLRNDGARWQIDATLHLPGTRPHRLQLALDSEGDPFSGDWEGTIYIGGEGAWPGELVGLSGEAGIPLPESIGYRIWSHWKNARLLDGQGHITLSDMVVDGTLNFRQVEADVSFHRTGDDSWRLHAGGLRLRSSNGDWPLSELVATVNWKAAQPWVIIQATTLRLQDIIPLLRAGGLGFASDPTLVRLNPRGDLTDVTAAWFDGPAGGRFFLRGGVRRLEVERVDPWPALEGLSGELVMDPRGGTLRLDSRDVTIRGGTEPLELRQAEGLLNWDLQGRRRELEVRHLALRWGGADLALRARMTDPGLPGQSPRLDLVGFLHNADAVDFLARLPTGLLPAKGEAWLKEGLHAGTLGGGVVFRGAVADYPFTAGEGRFELLLGLENGVLDYARGWPEVTALDAEIDFDGRSVVIEVASGTLFDTPLAGVHAEIPDLRKPTMAVVEGSLGFPTARGMAFVRQSPLNDTLGARLARIDVSGDLGLDLRLEILFRGEHRVRPAGAIRLTGNALRERETGLVLGDLKGRLPFDAEGLLPTRITARLLEQPVELELGRSRIVAQDEFPGVTLRGVLDRGSASAWLAALSEGRAGWVEELGFLKALRGQARWQATLRPGQDTQGYDLVIRSDLRGLALETPAPLGKPAEEARRLEITTRLDRSPSRKVRFRYGDLLAGELGFEERGGRLSLQRAEVRLGKAGNPPSTDALFLIYGHLPELDLAAWTNWLREMLPDRIDPRRIGDLPGTALDLQVDQLLIYGQRVDQVRVTAASNPGRWEIRIDGRQAKGTIEVPRGVDQGPIFADFERLELAHQPLEGNNRPMDPRRIPQM
ncbi:MAG: hypothetical protein D6786_06425, partial [Gammaproteobacteria bacterium]